MSDAAFEEVLSDVLAGTRRGAATLAGAELVPPWGLEMDPHAAVAVHVVLRGRAWLRLAARGEPVALVSGDVVLLRAGVAHSLADALDSRVTPYRDALAAMPARLAALPAARAHETTRVLCAKYMFQEPGVHPLLSLLPPLIHVPRGDADARPQLRLLIELLGHELAGGRGAGFVVPRLVDSLLVFVLRAWLEAQPLDVGGWFCALRDPAIVTALSLIHGRPEAPWSVESLARRAGQSRATFARRFVELVGETPIAYVRRWRMCLAAKLLCERDASLDELAARVGYETGAALSKAFRRVHGVAPGRYRERAASGEPTRAASPQAG
ncbi:MAG: AraC family transcriptional regulator [Myxococcales bacterium]|nr:AraC family transcriptional regulator [Myxococcales bacterium]MCB9753066.1 AraC family transcriptional regulator [Myxococcales bacterium]